MKFLTLSDIIMVSILIIHKSLMKIFVNSDYICTCNFMYQLVKSAYLINVNDYIYRLIYLPAINIYAYELLWFI